MKRELRFIRLSERWFLDILWEGSVDDLDMVGNTNLLLSAYLIKASTASSRVLNIPKFFGREL